VRQKTELLLSETHQINLYACLDVISFRHVSLIEDACGRKSRLSKTRVGANEVCGRKSHASRSFFLVFIMTCVKLLNSHV